MTSNDSVALSQVLSIQAGGRLPLSTALYACSEVARLVATEHDMSRTVTGLDADHIRCTRSGGVVLGGARVHHPDTKADVHAVGALFYRLLTGKTPASRDVVAPSHFNPGVDSELDALILASLAADASQRPASVRVLESALAAIFEELELTPTPDGLAEVVKSAVPQRRVSVASTPVLLTPVVAPKPIIVAKPVAHRPPPGWYAADEGDDEETVAEAPSWQTQERERKWMVGGTAALVAIALLWVLWPASKVSHASLDDTPKARVSARR